MVKGAKSNKQTILCMMAFVIYAMLTLIGALTHEIWFDECQAWCIVRDNNLIGVFDTLKYEGHPPLWYLILYPLAHLGFSCNVLPIISWISSCVTVGLILRKAPFNIITKIALAFSGGFMFSLSVISRSYCLIPLILCLIAVIYPERKNHPIILGVLVALLANTHVFMCGLVGIIGIYMIMEFFGDWKKDTPKQRCGKSVGLLISGIGVAVLVLPLIKSLSLNYSTSLSETDYVYKLITLTSGMVRVLNCTIKINSTTVLNLVISAVALLLLVFQAIFLRHYRKALIAELVFLVFYIAIIVFIWYPQPTKAYPLLYTLIFIYWTAKNSENPKACEHKLSLNLNSKLFIGILKALKALDKQFDRTITVILTTVLIFTIPTGVYWLFYDYNEPFISDKAVADYIRDELPEDSVIVIEDMSCAQLSAHLPNIKFYSLQLQKFITYSLNQYPPNIIENNIDYDKVYEDLKDYNHIYYYFALPDQYDNNLYYVRENTLFVQTADAPDYLFNQYSALSEFDLDKEILSKTTNN